LCIKCATVSSRCRGKRRAVAADLRAIYGAATLPEAEQALEGFAERWDAKYPAISPSWLADWDRLTVFFDYPPAIRRAVYTTNAIESLNYSLRKVLKGRSAFPNDESIIKVLYMGLQHGPNIREAVIRRHVRLYAALTGVFSTALGVTLPKSGSGTSSKRLLSATRLLGVPSPTFPKMSLYSKVSSLGGS
jgi:transposase-like protein